jgi:hypothetical protein
MADEKIPQSQHDDPDKGWDTKGMRGMVPPEGGLLAGRIDGGDQGSPVGIPLKAGWQEGYFYAEGMDGGLVLVPGGSVEALCGSDGLQADKASLLMAFAERGLNPPKEVYLAYPSDPLLVFFRQYAELTDGGRDDHFANYLRMSRQAKEEELAASVPQPLADGNAAHREIAENYRLKHGGDPEGNIFTNFAPTSTILNRIKRNGHTVDQSALSETEKRARPDIAHARLLHLYEIKPHNLYAEGIAEALYYQSIFHKAAVKGMQLGPMGDPGVTGQTVTPQGELVWGSPAPGVILYEYLRPRQPGTVGDPVTAPRPVPVMPWASGGRQRVPAQEPKPLTPSAPEGTSLLDLEYWKRVTGITSTLGIIAYLIISEGSRIFPPRNLIPIP